MRAIWLFFFQERNEALRCGHVFHSVCLNSYATVKGWQMTEMICPVCKLGPSDSESEMPDLHPPEDVGTGEAEASADGDEEPEEEDDEDARDPPMNLDDDDLPDSDDGAPMVRGSLAALGASPKATAKTKSKAAAKGSQKAVGKGKAKCKGSPKAKAKAKCKGSPKAKAKGRAKSTAVPEAAIAVPGAAGSSTDLAVLVQEQQPAQDLAVPGDTETKWERVICDSCRMWTSVHRCRLISKGKNAWRCSTCGTTQVQLRRRFGAWPTDGFLLLSEDSWLQLV